MLAYLDFLEDVCDAAGDVFDGADGGHDWTEGLVDRANGLGGLRNSGSQPRSHLVALFHVLVQLRERHVDGYDAPEHAERGEHVRNCLAHAQADLPAAL